MKDFLDVSNRGETLRRATSQAVLRINPEIIKQIKNESSEVALSESAKIAATLAAKKTWELIPSSHLSQLENVKVDLSVRNEVIEIVVELQGICKSDLEIESLTAVSIAALTVYDMLRSSEGSVMIESIRLLRKSDEILEISEKIARKLKTAIIFINVSEHHLEKDKQAEKFIIDALSTKNADVVESKIISNTQKEIEDNIKQFCDEKNLDLIITCGGIGITPEDIVPEVTTKLIEKKIDGISEILRFYGQKTSPLVAFSRGVAGIRKSSLIINLPGNIREISESLDLLFPRILYVSKMLK
jgi:molybdenum cofactor biosynthesis protein MoaC